MDLSKLPRMSDTRAAESDRSAQRPTAAPEIPAQQAGAAGAPGTGVPPGHQPMYVEADAGPTGWVGLVVALLLVLMMPRFWQWLSHKAFGTGFTWTFSNPDGSPLAYRDSVYFLGDAAVAAFAVALLLEGIVLLTLSKWRLALWACFGVVALATALNLLYLVNMMTRGYGLQLFSLLAVLVGGFMCVTHWQLLKGPRRRYVMVEYA